eukprot:gb/GECH01007633.1/.p1 GENE.gb/GECH01007633.1/~~gb/GECH01007633.1/.p1  ORF type:complete len:197 (+),score=42.45 gb/GECH01007633.1/:1-591(+)
MTRKRITFVTGNKGKLREVQQILGDHFNIVSHKVDLPELQGEPQGITREKCERAKEAIKGPVFVEDTGLCFNALQGLPGPYIKWFLDKIGHDGLNKMLNGFDDKTAYALCTVAFSPGSGGDIHVFSGHTNGRIVPARQGENGFGWDPIFEAEDTGKTYSEMDKEEKNAISHRYRAMAALREFLVQNDDMLPDDAEV